MCRFDLIISQFDDFVNYLQIDPQLPVASVIRVLNKELNKIVFKESRGGKNFYSVGWENGNSYLRYHSGIGYRWFK